MLKRILVWTLTFFVGWIAFLWIKYTFFNKVYSQPEINSIFNNESLTPPEYDSVTSDGYQIYYLSNKKQAQANHAKKPFLILLHDSGKNSGHFLRYFKNPDFNKNFRIIAMDRVGFGKTRILFPAKDSILNHNNQLISQHFLKDVLKNEGYQDEEVRILSTGSASMAGLKAYLGISSPKVKVLMFYPKIDPRFIASRWISECISQSPLKILFPTTYINKHKDLLFWDKVRNEERNQWFRLARMRELELRKEKPDYSAMCFFVTHSSFESKINEIAGKNFFKTHEVKRRSIYRKPEFVYQEMQLCNAKK